MYIDFYTINKQISYKITYVNSCYVFWVHSMRCGVWKATYEAHVHIPFAILPYTSALNIKWVFEYLMSYYGLLQFALSVLLHKDIVPNNLTVLCVPGYVIASDCGSIVYILHTFDLRAFVQRSVLLLKTFFCPFSINFFQY